MRDEKPKSILKHFVNNKLIIINLGDNGTLKIKKVLHNEKCLQNLYTYLLLKCLSLAFKYRSIKLNTKIQIN